MISVQLCFNCTTSFDAFLILCKFQVQVLTIILHVRTKAGPEPPGELHFLSQGEHLGDGDWLERPGGEIHLQWPAFKAGGPSIQLCLEAHTSLGPIGYSLESHICFWVCCSFTVGGRVDPVRAPLGALTTSPCLSRALHSRHAQELVLACVCSD